jgi:serine O-acetyltransferase
VRCLTHQFGKVEVPDTGSLSPFRRLRADLRAKSVWYYGRSRWWLTLRMLFSDGSLCTVLYRLMRALRACRLAPLTLLVYKLNTLLTGAVIGRGAEFGPGLVILHSVGLVVNTSVRAGANVVAEGCVTIGAEKGRSPSLGDNVFLGSGAKVIGVLHIGDDARIGANAVVLEDVPDGATAVGVPARVVRTRREEP